MPTAVQQRSGLVLPAPMRERAGASRTEAGRLRLCHGPIDVILDFSGAPDQVARAEAAARAAFDGLLERLVAELPLLRAEVSAGSPDPEGPVALRMMRAVRPLAAEFITPMAAVAGAVADHLLAAVLAAARLRRAVVNNGGDIALFLAQGEGYRIGIHDHARFGRLAGTVALAAGDGIGGVATSGWRGRSHSLGIADAVTVLAADGAAADAAATLIANAVDLPGSALVRRTPAHALAPDSDLGARAVTVEVGRLPPDQVAHALAAGRARAEAFRQAGLIRAAFLLLQGQGTAVGERNLTLTSKGDGT